LFSSLTITQSITMEVPMGPRRRVVDRRKSLVNALPYRQRPRSARRFMPAQALTRRRQHSSRGHTAIKGTRISRFSRPSMIRTVHDTCEQVRPSTRRPRPGMILTVNDVCVQVRSIPPFRYRLTSTPSTLVVCGPTTPALIVTPGVQASELVNSPPSSTRATLAEARLFATCFHPAEPNALTVTESRILIEATPFFRRGGRTSRIRALQARRRSMVTPAGKARAVINSRRFSSARRVVQAQGSGGLTRFIRKTLSHSCMQVVAQGGQLVISSSASGSRGVVSIPKSFFLQRHLLSNLLNIMSNSGILAREAALFQAFCTMGTSTPRYPLDFDALRQALYLRPRRRGRPQAYANRMSMRTMPGEALMRRRHCSSRRHPTMKGTRIGRFCRPGMIHTVHDMCLQGRRSTRRPRPGMIMTVNDVCVQVRSVPPFRYRLTSTPTTLVCGPATPALIVTPGLRARSLLLQRLSIMNVLKITSSARILAREAAMLQAFCAMSTSAPRHSLDFDALRQALYLRPRRRGRPQAYTSMMGMRMLPGQALPRRRQYSSRGHTFMKGTRISRFSRPGMIRTVHDTCVQGRRVTRRSRPGMIQTVNDICVRVWNVPPFRYRLTSKPRTLVCAHGNPALIVAPRLPARASPQRFRLDTDENAPVLEIFDLTVDDDDAARPTTDEVPAEQQPVDSAPPFKPRLNRHDLMRIRQAKTPRVPIVECQYVTIRRARQVPWDLSTNLIRQVRNQQPDSGLGSMPRQARSPSPASQSGRRTPAAPRSQGRGGLSGSSKGTAGRQVPRDEQRQEEPPRQSRRNTKK